MSSQPGGTHSRFLALQDRAYAFVTQHQPVAEATLLAHTYGGSPPPALHAQLAAPLLEDPRLERRADGHWTVAFRRSEAENGGLPDMAVSTLALAVTAANPARGRIVSVAAEHVRAGEVLERFTATVNPGRRVPRYVAERLGLAAALLEDLPPLATIVDDLVAFLGARPVVAQDARLTWAYLEAETRRLQRVLAGPVLVDANEIANHLLELRGKPSLALVAAQLGIGTVRIGRPEEEARVLGQVASRLLELADRRGYTALSALLQNGAADGRGALRRDQTALSQPDEPGVYILRDTGQTPLYVGKARRLRSRLAAYVHRPLGATRRLEGLVGSVDAVDSTVCATDLEALVLEDREIRRLQPRFNTVRHGRTPRLWIRLPPLPAQRPGKRQLAPRRLESSLGPGSADGEFVGPFRNETLAEQARLLARRVFDLDELRGGDRQLYAARLQLAWSFLASTGPERSNVAETYARQRSSRLLRAVLAFDLQAMLLPADPRQARYAVVRFAQRGIEAFLLDRGILRAWRVVDDFSETPRLAAELLGQVAPRTGPEDVDIVLRWMGAQRPPARLVHLPLDPLAATDAVESAALGLLDGL